MADKTPEFGEIQKVDVKDVWPHEEHDFTPWLAVDENLQRLADSLGVELEIEGIEVAVGPYSADILAKDVGTNRYVVIENQYGKTNHDHLGKLITYASFLDAEMVVWIAEHFTEEHQKAIDWINDRTTEELSFYAVSLELWKIDNSRPAVRFNVVSRPNELVKQASAAKATGELSETRQLQLEFWTAFADRLIERGVVKKAHAPRPQYWFDVSLGRAGVVLSNIANTQQNRIGVRLYISHKLADWMLPVLELEKDAIEKEIGVQLAWNPHPNNHDKIVAASRNADLTDRESWEGHLDWMVEMVARCRAAFGPRVKKAVQPPPPPVNTTAALQHSAPSTELAKP